jgi:serine/threonine-protein kinase RsbW
MRIANEIAEVGRLIAAVQAYFLRRGVSEDATYPLTMAIEEAVTNVIRHGYADGEVHAMTVRVVSEDGRQTAEVIDDGIFFDPTVGSGGFGIGLHLIKTMVDAIEYVRDVDRNCLRMIKSHSQS